MKKALSIFMVSVLMFCMVACGGAEEKTDVAPYFKGVQWNDTMDAVKKIEKGTLVETTVEDGKDVLKYENASVPFGEGAFDVEYIFENDMLVSIHIVLPVKGEKTQTAGLYDWVDKYYYHHGDMDENTSLYVANSDNKSVVAVQNNEFEIDGHLVGGTSVTIMYYSEGIE